MERREPDAGGIPAQGLVQDGQRVGNDPPGHGQANGAVLPMAIGEHGGHRGEPAAAGAEAHERRQHDVRKGRGGV